MSFYFRSEIAQTNKASKQPSAALRIVRSTLAWLETRCQKECGNFGINSKIGVLQPSSPYRPRFIWSMVVFQQETGTPCRSGRIYAYVCYVQFTKSTLLPNNQCDIYSNEHLDDMTKAADLEQRESLQPAENSSIIAAWPQAVILLSVKWTAQFPHPADASGRGVVFISLLRVSCYKSTQRHIRAVDDIIQLKIDPDFSKRKNQKGLSNLRIMTPLPFASLWKKHRRRKQRLKSFLSK